MKVIEKTNVYDKLLLFLVFLTGFGGIGGSLQFVRVAAILLLPVFINKYGGCRYAKGFLLAFAIFYVYCLLSLSWTPNKSEGFKELVYYPVHFLLFLEIIVFSRSATNPFKSISLGWLFAILLCSVIAYWEITTGNHLQIAKEHREVYNTGYELYNFVHANATFFNLNGYVTYLCFGLPWLFYGVKSTEGFYYRILYIVAIIASIITILINASRGGLVSLVIMVSVFFMSSFKGRMKWSYLFLFFVALIIVVYYFYSHSMFAIMFYRSSNGGLLNGDSRFVIWSRALKVVGDTLGFGTGIGGMTNAMDVYANGSINITHNLFLEILVQYGFVFTIVFIVFLWRQLKTSLKLDPDRKTVLMMALISMPIYCIINSGYLLNADLYVLLATIVVFSNNERIKYSYRTIRQTE